MSEPGIIYYTLNGSDPSKYSKSISITNKTILKFLAVDMVGNESPLYSQNYNIDKVQPKVKMIDPASNTIKILTNKVINITFSKTIQAGTMWIELKNSLGLPINITSTIKGNVLTINHSLPLQNGVYVLAIHTGSIKDLAGNLLTLFTSRFTVGIPLTVQSIIIKNSVVNGQTNQIIKVLFNEPIKAGNMKIELKTSSGKEIPFKTTISGNTLNLVIKNLLKKGSKYDIIFYTCSITDLKGNYLCYYSRVIQV
jgi:methionine-rich copper-binding protein CopC